MNFDSILIVTYGRSGSTLLQGIMNSHEEVLLRGENHNFCKGLFQSYLSLTKTRKFRHGTTPTNPFFGSVFLDEEYYLSMTRKMVKNLLLADQIGNEKIKCFGFKEIRYEQMPLMLDEYLNFLKQIFPNPAFIINTRNKEDVLNSRIKINWLGRKSMESLEKIESAFFDFIGKNQDCTFHITYEDVIDKTKKLSLLHSFLGLPYSEEKVDHILTYQHSNTLIQSGTEKSKISINSTAESIEDFKLVSIEERHLAQLKKELQQKEEKISSKGPLKLSRYLRSLIPSRKTE